MDNELLPTNQKVGCSSHPWRTNKFVINELCGFSAFDSA